MESYPWRIHGEIIDTCNCEVICPCTLGAPPTEGKCLGNVLWSIDEGRYGSVDLTGLAVVLALYAPGPKFDDGNWRVAMYGDERATSEQRGTLETIFLGRAGGFFDEWRGLTAEVVGVKWLPIQVERVGRKRTVRIGEVLEIRGPLSGQHRSVKPLSVRGLRFALGSARQGLQLFRVPLRRAIANLTCAAC